MAPLESLKEAFRQGNQAPLGELYTRHRGEFIGWAQQTYKVSEGVAVDIFQDVMVIFFRNVSQGKLTRLESSVKTYLFGIGKNLLRRHLQKKGKELPLDPEFDLPDAGGGTMKIILQNERQQTLLKALEELGEPCKQLLHLFYYQQLSIKEIQAKMAYKSAQVVKTQKSRCVQYLRKLIPALKN